MNFHKNNKCRICTSDDLEDVLPLKCSPLADSYILKASINQEQKLFDMNVFLCKNCGLVQLLTVVEPEEIYIDYLYKTTTSVGLSQHFIDSAASIIKRYNLEQNSFIVDIGSNIGSLLYGYKNCGMKVLGIDPAVEIAKEATLNGIETLPIFFDLKNAKDIVNKYGRANIINANNMMANIDSINEIVIAIKELLDENGVFIMETSYILYLIENMVFDTIYHEHLSYFGLKPLEYLFLKHNLKVVDAEIINTKGGSIKCYIEHNKNQNVSQNIINIRSLEMQKGLYNNNLYKEFQIKINYQKQVIINFLDKCIMENKIIYGYGASNTTTTLLHHFEIAQYIQYIVDDNNIKIGRYSPNYHIPVVSSDIIYDNQPDYIIIFAWRFADIIIKKHQSFLDNGGKFIIPLPEFKVITGDNK